MDYIYVVNVSSFDMKEVYVGGYVNLIFAFLFINLGPKNKSYVVLQRLATFLRRA